MYTLQTKRSKGMGFGSLWRLALAAYSAYTRDYLSLVAATDSKPLEHNATRLTAR